jgi:transposase-like protein
MSKKHRRFTDEFKAEVVALCRQGDRNASQVARDLGLTDSAVRRWVEQASGAQPSSSEPLAADEREELSRLRKENARLRMVREILKKAAAFFAKENA